MATKPRQQVHNYFLTHDTASLKDVAQGLDLSSSSVSNAVAALMATGEIERVQRGVYKASTPKPAAKIPKKKIPGKVRAKKVESVEDEEITLTEYTITISSDDDSLFDLLTQHLGQKTVDDLVLLAMYHDRFVRVKG